MSENKENTNLIAYCGLFCSDCPAYLGRISNIAMLLRKELRRTEYNKFAKLMSKNSASADLKDFDTCYAVLGAMTMFRCEKGCRKGGGSSSCRIRLCCQEKKLEGCWQCDQFEKCKKLDAHNALHGNAHRENLRAIQKKGKEEFVKGVHLWST